MSDQNNAWKPIKLNANPKLIIRIAIILAVIAVLSTSVYQVDQTERGVVTRFGKYIKTTEPGLQFKLPFGIENAYKVPTEIVQTEEFGFKTVQAGVSNQYINNINSVSTMLTGDLNIVDVEWIIQYRIVDPVAWLFNVQERQQTIRDISQSVVNTLVGDRAIFDVMQSERASIETIALTTMNETFTQYGLGIRVSEVKLQNIVPPSQVQSAFEDVNKATQDMDRLINEGKEAYNKEIPRLRGEAEQQVLIAEGYATERVNRAEGDVARFNAVYSEYVNAPTVTRDRLYLEAMETIFNSEKVNALIDKNLENVLPIKNLTQGGAQ